MKKEFNKQVIAGSASAVQDKGFSLPSVIIGSIIAAVLGTIAVSSMWGSVDKAKIAAEKASISEMRTVTTGVLESVGGFPSQLGTTEDSAASAKVSNLSNELKYQLIYSEAGTTATSDDYILLKAYAVDADAVNHLKSMVETLDEDINGTAVGNGVAGSKFSYDTTCTATDGTPDTPQEDCFYVAYVTAKSAAPATIGAATVITDGTESEVRLGAVDDADASAAIPADNLTELN